MVYVSRAEMDRVRKMAKLKAAKKAEKRASLPWGQRDRMEKTAKERAALFPTFATILSRSKIKEQIMTDWAYIVKARDRFFHGPLCRICGIRPGDTAYHLVPRQRGWPIACDLENGVLSCGPCNNSERNNRSLFQDVKHPAIFGVEFIAKLKARLRRKVPTTELLEIRERFKEIIRTQSWKIKLDSII